MRRSVRRRARATVERANYGPDKRHLSSSEQRKMSGTRCWRQAAKRIVPLYWLVGLLNYVGFRVRLTRANRIEPGGGWLRVPPPSLRYRVHRAFDSASYLDNGRSIARCLADALSAQGVALKDLVVLDFACGPGRVIGELASAAEACTLFGSDIDVQAIAWASENLSSLARFSVNTTAAPITPARCLA